MPKKAGDNSPKKANGANLGFEEKLWQAADKMRNNMDAAEYKHVVLGLIFLKYISDTFAEHHAALEADRKKGADPEDKDEYLARNIFWVPKAARWANLQASAKQPMIGKLIDDAMVAVERDNKVLKGVLPKDYARPTLDKQRLGELIDLVGTIGLGDKENRSKDILGRVYEYFLSQFASAEGKKGGQFYTPRCVVRVLVEMLAPYKGRVYDPCCGSGGMFVQSEKFIEEHGGRTGDISIYGQESNPTTWKLAKMNLAIRGIDSNLGSENADSFHRDLHPDLKADFVLANPPFNSSDWGGERLREDKRWKYGIPPTGNANFAWVQHFVSHLNPTGIAGFVLANGSMSSNTSGEGEIRKALIEADMVDCMVAMPGQLFYSTQIPVCLWFLARDKKNGRPVRRSSESEGGFRDRRGKVLFIDARKLGTMIDRVHRELTDEDVRRIADTYHAWRGDLPAPSVERQAGLPAPRSSRQASLSAPSEARQAGLPAPSEARQAGKDCKHKYADVAGFCKSAKIEEIRSHGHILTPGRYVGAAEVEDDLPAPRPGVFFVYAIACEGGSHYIGFTDDIPRRWKEHASGQGADWTKAHKPRNIVHYEEYNSREEAVAREKELKTTSGRRWLKDAIAEGRARQAGGEPFDAKMKRLTAELKKQSEEGVKLDKAIWANLKGLGYGG